MHKMETELASMRQQAMVNEQGRMNLFKEHEMLKTKFEEEKTEKEFFRTSALENKRQKKLLKIAL